MPTVDIEQPESLQNYLINTGHLNADESLEIKVLDGGVSNRTVWIRFASGEEWVLKQALEKLRVPVDWFSNPSRIHNEARGLRWLQSLTPPGSVPDFVFEDETHHILAMQAIPVPHQNWKKMLLAGEVNMAHIQQFAHLLATIHRHASQSHEQIARAFADTAFFETLRLEPYYLYTAQQVPKARHFLHTLVDETRQTQLTLVHGDYSPKNILVYNNYLILLDHEVVHFGDPAFDLGFCMTHLLSKAHHLPQQRETFAGATQIYWDTYFTDLGDVAWRDTLEARAVRHTLACLLARVAGRSPLEYMDGGEKSRQKGVVSTIMRSPPRTIAELIEAFLGGINTYADD